MLKNILNSIKDDVRDIEGLVNCENGEMTDEIVVNQARAIVLNMREHIDEIANYFKL